MFTDPMERRVLLAMAINQRQTYTTAELRFCAVVQPHEVKAFETAIQSLHAGGALQCGLHKVAGWSVPVVTKPAYDGTVHAAAQKIRQAIGYMACQEAARRPHANLRLSPQMLAELPQTSAA
jgi:hypothetical protein